MSYTDTAQYSEYLIADTDRRNVAAILAARDAGRIDDAAAVYLTRVYSDSMKWFRELFYFLGKCFGAPKTAVMRYDYETNSAIEETISISDINPLSPYIVQHRLDADPMRNQFFTSGVRHKIDLAVSSIVTIIVGAQKSLSRALDKVTGKYYDAYVQQVNDTIISILTERDGVNYANKIAKKIRAKMAEKYISSPSETVLKIMGRGREASACELIRALDKLQKPHELLQDVWRVKCLFDMVPQARTFMERVKEVMPERVLSSRDMFYDMENPRNYRAAKLMIDIGHDGNVVPLEIICQMRTFFDFERQTHTYYEMARTSKGVHVDNLERKLSDFMEGGIKEYNKMVCQCLDDLFERVGWNILYSQDGSVYMLDGFPKKCKLYYPQRILDQIIEKLDDAVNNEVFSITNAPARLTHAQQNEIFRFMARFILITAMPYAKRNWRVPDTTMAGKLFNFVMKEVQRYYKKK